MIGMLLESYLKLVALTIFVKYGAAFTIYHFAIKEKLRFLYQNHRAYSDNFMSVLCFHGV